MTTTPNEPVRDSDIETGAGLGSSAAPGATGPGDGRDGVEGGPLDTQDETDADGTDGSDADGTDGSDADGTDADGSDADGSDADGTDA